MRLKTISVITLLFSILTLANLEPQSSASQPLISFCYKTYPKGSGSKPTVFALPRNGTMCSKGFALASGSNVSLLVDILNGISSSSFRNGYALGSYQTSIADMTLPCQMSQPGCHP